MKKILAAVDGSVPALHAAKLALELARATGAELTLVYSVAPTLMPGQVPFTVVNQVLKAEAERGKELVTEAAKALNDDRVKARVLEGPPAEQIAHLAESEGFDLVVIGSRGMNAVARMFVGSVADRVVHLCKQPVLVSR